MKTRRIWKATSLRLQNTYLDHRLHFEFDRVTTFDDNVEELSVVIKPISSIVTVHLRDIFGRVACIFWQ